VRKERESLSRQDEWPGFLSLRLPSCKAQAKVSSALLTSNCWSQYGKCSGSMLAPQVPAQVPPHTSHPTPLAWAGEDGQWVTLAAGKQAQLRAQQLAQQQAQPLAGDAHAVPRLASEARLQVPAQGGKNVGRAGRYRIIASTVW